MYLKAVSAEEMRRADENAKAMGISEDVLIENAANALYEECPKVKRVLIMAGPGNNGADGFALARKLFLSGVRVEVLTLKKSSCNNAKIAERLGIKISDFYEREDFCAELYVDALFGTGLSRDVEGKALEMIEYFNSRNGFKLAVDIPSGINSDTGAILGAAVSADKTVSFAFAKFGLYQYPGADYAGEVKLKNIFIPDTLEDTKKYIVNSAKIRTRERNTHKGTYGNLLTLCGSCYMSGAAYMSAAAAVKSGCGLVRVGVPDLIRETVAQALPEAMVTALPSRGGYFCDKSVFEAKEYFSKANTLLIGCGIGNNENSAYFVYEAVKAFKGNKVIDADGLNVLSKHKECLEGAVITPHPGEMARLIGKDIAFVESDRVSVAKNFAEEYGCTVVLKGARTVTAYPDGRIYINIKGNPGMATGGSGDVLAGLTASFSAQGISDAVQTAVFVHSLAGDLAAEETSENSISATDILKMIPKAIKITYENGKNCAE